MAGLKERIDPSDESTDNEIIKYYEKSISYAERADNNEWVEEMTTWACMTCTGRGNYQRGIEFCQQSLRLNLKETSRKKSRDYRDYLVQQAGSAGSNEPAFYF